MMTMKQEAAKKRQANQDAPSTKKRPAAAIELKLEKKIKQPVDETGVENKESWLRYLRGSQTLKALEKPLKSGCHLLFEELCEGAKACLLAWCQQLLHRDLIVITGAAKEESRLQLNLPFFTQAAIHSYPSWETLPHEQIAPSPDIVGERYRILRCLRTSQSPQIAIGDLQSFLQKLILPQTFDELYLCLKPGDEISFATLHERFAQMGYQRCDIAADKGEYAIRGCIVDLYPVGADHPFRMEFWGDEIERLCSYDPVTQTSTMPLKSIEIAPGQELELLQRQSRLATIFDYLQKPPLIVFDDLLEIEDRYAAIAALCSGSSHHFCTMHELMGRLADQQKLYFSNQPIEDLTTVNGKKSGHYYSKRELAFDIQADMLDHKLTMTRCRHPFQKLKDEDVSENGLELEKPIYHLVAETEKDAQALLSSFIDKEVEADQFCGHCGYLSDGFAIPELNLLLLPSASVTHHFKVKREKQRSAYHVVPSQLFDLAPGDLVVHYHNGIGRFIGVKKQKSHLGSESEYMELQYSEGSTLFVPMQQAHLVSKYIGAGGDSRPPLHALGSNKWKRTKEKSQQAIVGYAKELLELYAARQMRQGFAYPPDSEQMRSFEEEFPFIETEDQLAAIAQVKADMCSTRPMDRLICGDVGYGKTEVAMRAAFKAVIDGGKQVAMLVPTTVLAMQHYENFCVRMQNHAVNIAVLSRFRSAKEVKETLTDLSEGHVDIIIGTHRLLSSDVLFKDLGLVIIDEEQRFGVRSKEKLKKFKAEVDCLTLSATPIPRTLHLSLSGGRELSVINTPPEERLPIISHIAEPNDEVIKTALLRELGRQGQAYFVHNRIESIWSVAERLKHLLPQARIGVAHGQMSSDELDTIFHAFKKGEIEILISTAIIENGIDIRNANTILIDKAETFGLASLYQMRGRVGRWNRRAYCYFLVKQAKSLPEVTHKRLTAIASSSGWGSGFKIAMRDLEIRGAGNILGTEQSGQVADIGFHLYCKLLKKTMERLQGCCAPSASDVRCELAIDARLPEEYVDNIGARMEFYQRFGDAEGIEEVDKLWLELQDRYGPPPPPAHWLYRLTRIRIEAAIRGYTNIKQEKKVLVLEQQVNNRLVKHSVVFNYPKTAEAMEKAMLKLFTR